MSDLSKLTEKTLGKFKISPVTDTPPNINLLVYGDSGIGKTRLAGSASVVDAMKPVLFIDVEGGTFSLRELYPQVDVVRVQTWLDMQGVYDELYKGGHGYKTVVLDSLTEIQKFSMYNIMQDLIRVEKDRDPDIPSVREWGKNIEQMRKMVRAFRDLPINTIFTALAQGDRNPKTGVTVTRPQLSGKLGGEVAAFLDFVLYMYVRSTDEGLKRLLLTTQTDTVIAKDRSAKLPSVIGAEDEDVTMQTIYDCIFTAQQTQAV